MATKNQSFNWDITLKVLGWVAVSGLMLLLLAFVVGGPFRPILHYMGLEIRGFGGVFINCDEPANARADFCRPNEERLRDRTEVKKEPVGGLPFSLSE